MVSNAIMTWHDTIMIEISRHDMTHESLIITNILDGKATPFCCSLVVCTIGETTYHCGSVLHCRQMVIPGSKPFVLWWSHLRPRVASGSLGDLPLQPTSGEISLTIIAGGFHPRGGFSATHWGCDLPCWCFCFYFVYLIFLTLLIFF